MLIEIDKGIAKKMKGWHFLMKLTTLI